MRAARGFRTQACCHHIHHAVSCGWYSDCLLDMLSGSDNCKHTGAIRESRVPYQGEMDCRDNCISIYAGLLTFESVFDLRRYKEAEV